MKFARFLCILSAALLTGCATQSTPPSAVVPPSLECPAHEIPLVVRVSCPADLPALADPTMGALAATLYDVAQQYHTCRQVMMEAW